MTQDEQSKLNDCLAGAANRGDTVKIEALLATGADVHVGDDGALRLAAEHGHTETVRVLLASGAYVHAIDDDALCSAAMTGHTETVKVLLASGANVHAADDRLLYWVAQNGHTETLRVLQEALKNEIADRLELERQQNPLSVGTGLTLAKSGPEDLDALLREAIAEQSSPERPDGGEYASLPLCPR